MLTFQGCIHAFLGVAPAYTGHAHMKNALHA